MLVGLKIAILQNIKFINHTLAATYIFIRQIKVYVYGQVFFTKEVGIERHPAPAFSTETFSRNMQITR